MGGDLSALAIICARAGSRRFPDKNRASVGGVPLIERALDAVVQAHNRVVDAVVTTDDLELLSLARVCGAHPVHRPAELATDTAAIEDAARHAYRVWCAMHKKHPEFVAVIQANCPIWKPGTLGAMLRRLEAGDCTAVITAHPVREQGDWSFVIDDGGYARFAYLPDRARAYRQQDLKPTYRSDGQCVVLRADTLLDPALEGQQRIAYGWLGDKIVLHVREWRYGWDIDEPEDLRVAEALCATG